MGRLRAAVIITLIESVAFLAGVGVWFALDRAGDPVGGAIVGTVLWTVITGVEHYVAIVPPGYKPE